MAQQINTRKEVSHKAKELDKVIINQAINLKSKKGAVLPYARSSMKNTGIKTLDSPMGNGAGNA